MVDAGRPAPSLSDEQAHAMLQSMLDPFILLGGVRDDDGALIDLRYIEVNDAAVAYNNLSRDQMVGARLLDLFPGQLDHGPLRQYFHTIETGEPTVLDDYSYGHEIIGEERRYDIRATKCGDGIALTWRDVTDRHRVAQSLHDSEEQYRLLADNSSDVIMLGSLAEGLTWVSPSVTTVLRREPDEVLGFGMSALVHPDDLPVLRQVAERAIESREDLRYRYRVHCGDGAYRWVEGLSHWIPEDAAPSTQRLIRLRDIDDQVRAEHDLAASEQLYRLLAENSSDMVILRDEELIIRWASPSCENVLGISIDDILGRSVNDFVPPEDVAAMDDQISHMHRNGSAMQYRIRARTASGTYRWFSGNSRPLPGDAEDGRRWVVSLSDIDEQVRAEDSLREREGLYRLLAENSTDIVILADDSFTALWVSPSLTEVTGWLPEELVGHDASQFIHPADWQRERPGPPGVHRTFGTAGRLRLRCSDGSYLWMEAVAQAVATDSPVAGSPQHVVRLHDIEAQVRAEQDLSERERLYRLLAENSTDAILLASGPDATCAWASPSVAALLGWTPEELTGRRPVDLIHPEDLAAAETSFAVAVERGEDVRQQYRVRRSDGSYLWVEAAARLVPGADPFELVVRLRDVDDQVRAQRQLSESERLYRLLAENASDVVWQVRDDGTLTWISPSAEAVFGRPASELLGTASELLVCAGDRERFARSAEQVGGGHSATGEFRICGAGGQLRWMEVSVHAANTSADAVRIATLRDVDDTVRARKGLEFALQHDQATGLPTRPAMARSIDRALQALPRAERLAVLLVGVDLLGDVNDAYGHVVGDMVITATATRLAKSLGRPELLGRGSGDEFIVIMPEVPSAAAAVTLAEQLRAEIRGDLEAGGQALSLSASVGIAISEPGSTAVDLLREATTALHRAKELGRDRWSFADPERAGDAARRLALESEVRAGLDAGEFVPWFQPVVSLADNSLAGYEALARWQHNGRTLEPVAFLDVLLHSQWVTELDHAVVEPSVRALAGQADHVFVSVNVTGLTLTRTDYSAHVRDCLSRLGVDPRRLHIEVTETMLINLDDAVMAQMIELADLGVRWYVDDFGTGYSAISHLRDMPVSGLKLDRSFTAGIGRGDATARHLANGLVGLANGLGLDTIAEGVETQAEADYLRTLGWQHAQGWLFGKAAPLT